MDMADPQGLAGWHPDQLLLLQNMADSLSQGSLDSAGDEFVVVNAEPRLKIANNGDCVELEEKLCELLNDDASPPRKLKNTMATNPTTMATNPTTMATSPTTMATSPTTMATSPTTALESLKRDAENEKNQIGYSGILPVRLDNGDGDGQDGDGKGVYCRIIFSYG